MAFDNYSRVTTSVTYTSATGVTFDTSEGTTATFSYSDIQPNLISTLEDADQLMVWFIFTEDSTTATVSDLSDADAKTLMQIPRDRWTVDTSAKTITLKRMDYGNDGTSTAETAGGFTRPAISETLDKQTIIVTRSTYQLDKQVTWLTGSRLTARQLNLGLDQVLHLAQEIETTLDNSTISLLPAEVPTTIDLGTQAPTFQGIITAQDGDDTTETVKLDGTDIGTTGTIIEAKDASTVFAELGGTGIVKLYDNSSGTPDTTEYVIIDPTVIGTTSNALQVYDGAIKFTVTGEGKTGIGTGATAPRAALDVIDSSQNVAAVFQSSTSAGTGCISLMDDDTSGINVVHICAVNDAMKFTTNTSKEVYIDNSGNLGVGKSAPASELHIVSTTTAPDDGAATLVGGEQAFFTSCWDSTSTGNITITITHDNTEATQTASVHDITYTTRDDAHVTDYQVTTFKLFVISSYLGAGTTDIIGDTHNSSFSGTGISSPAISSSHTAGVTTVTITDTSATEAEQDHRNLFIHSMGRKIVSYDVAQA